MSAKQSRMCRLCGVWGGFVWCWRFVPLKESRLGCSSCCIARGCEGAHPCVYGGREARRRPSYATPAVGSGRSMSVMMSQFKGRQCKCNSLVRALHTVSDATSVGRSREWDNHQW